MTEFERRSINKTIQESNNWEEWRTLVTETTCKACIELDGKIRLKGHNWNPKPPLHKRCRCSIKRAFSILAGTLTNLGNNGVDWYLKNKKELPDYYISKYNARKKGWKKNNTLDKVAPGYMIGGDRFYNNKNKLPPNHEWYEADFGYIYGYRNDCRVLYTKDKDRLIFATFDHYDTFYEIR